ncbi:MAG: DUF3386 family protein [Gemmataceae bacterium]|nr:DUF3386 family protein [Gemmataceae bacterium]
MKRLLFTLVLAAIAVPTARAHFIWIVPEKDGTAKVVFSDSLEPDDPKLLAKIGKTACYARDAEGQASPIKWKDGKDAYLLTAPGKGPQLLGGVCAYGVIQRGQTEPFLLNYYATALVGAPTAGRAGHKFYAPWDTMPLQIVPSHGGYTVLWQGKPLADAEVTAILPGKEKPAVAKTNDKGQITLTPEGNGLCGLRVRHTEKKEGKLDDKEYKEVRHYATFVFALAAAAPSTEKTPPAENLKEDPAATKLLADARAARAQWPDFAGFTADAEVNFDGKVHKAKVTVSGDGKVRFDGLDKDVDLWARRTLGSIVGHRTDNSGSRNTPAAFTDDVKDHPQGRAIKVLNDELHSSYRIKDNQITEVNRAMKDRRFTITVLENKLNAENKYLSVSFVVNYWDLTNGELVRSEANHHTWTRVGKFDLPATAKVVTGTPAKKAEGGGNPGLTAQSLTLTNHKLEAAK